MTNPNKLVPRLRFKDDEGRNLPIWEETVFFHIVEKVNESFNPAKASENYRCVELESLESNTGRLLDTFESINQTSIKSKFQVGDILFGKLRPYLRKFYFAKFIGVCTSEIWVLRSNSVVNKFAFYLIQTEKFQRVSTIQSGTKMPRSDWSTVSNAIFCIPSSQEQQKIASFLSAVDRKIEQLKQKKTLLEQFKKGMMQKLFSQEIRFKDDEGREYPEWEKKLFSELFISQATRRYQIKSSEVLKKGDFPVVDQGKSQIAGYSNDREKLLSSVDGVVVYGDHTTVVKFVDFEFIVGADGTKVLLSTKGNMIKYLYFALSNFNCPTEGYKRHFSIVKKLILPAPVLEEQEKIAFFLSSIDKKIELVEKQIELAQSFKKGLLQQMFV